MDWALWLPEQLPHLLILPPIIGFLTAAVYRHRFPRWFPTVIAAVTLVILGGLMLRLESDSAAEIAARVPSDADRESTGTPESAQEFVHRRVDRQRVQRIAGRLLLVDGLNLWPITILVIVAFLVVQRDTVASNSGFVAAVYLFETTALISLLANDVRVFLLASEIHFLTFGVMLGLWGGLHRRGIAERYLIEQFGAALLVTIGLATLTISVPWMKIEDSPTRPPITYEFSTLIYEIQKWTTTNELSFQYSQHVFPWMMLVLSSGLAIQFGWFPFHSTQTAILGRVSGELASLYLAGLLPLFSVAWWRFVLPLSPELLSGFDWLILVSTLSGAVWPAIRALVTTEPRQRLASVFVSLSSLSFLGCHSFTRYGLCAAWLMQQQLALLFCVMLLAWTTTSQDDVPIRPQQIDSRKAVSNRTVLLLMSIPCLGLLASGSVIVIELIDEGIWIPLCLFVVAGLSGTVLCISGISHRFVPLRGIESILLLSMTAVTSVVPGWLMHQSEREFARVFRRFDDVAPAVSAGPNSEDRQSSP